MNVDSAKKCLNRVFKRTLPSPVQQRKMRVMRTEVPNFSDLLIAYLLVYSQSVEKCQINDDDYDEDIYYD